MSEIIFNYVHNVADKEEFELTIYAKYDSIIRKQSQYKKTLQNAGYNTESSDVLFNQQAVKNKVSFADQNLPIFFENTQYVIEFIFNHSPTEVNVLHKLENINQQFHYNQRNKTLTGVLNTSNHIGYFTLPFSYQSNGRIDILSFEVLPTKIDVKRDLPPMYQAIDEIYPLWRFSFTATTEQNTGRSEEKGTFPLLWLAYFQQLQAEFIQALKIIQQMPHRRLQEYQTFQAVDKIKKKIPYSLNQKIVNDLRSGITHKKYLITQQKLSADTPENRFIKFVVNQVERKIEKIAHTLKKVNDPEQGKFSQAFFELLASWQKPLKQFLSQPFLKEVGEFSGFHKASLVLQQKTGYNKVYYLWQELKHYLTAFSDNATISMKSIAEIYEIWCFLTLRKILIEDLGFIEEHIKVYKPTISKFMDYQFDKNASVFKLRKKNIQITLSHEPEYSKESRDLNTYWTSQRPDIVLDVLFNHQQRFIWLFDAKYRVDEDNKVPEDAINQMHRYRDALILRNKQTPKQKSRPVLGAFALYPGYFKQNSEDNPYQEVIQEVGIGAFALLPSQNYSGHIWLKNFLSEHLTHKYHNAQSEELYIQEPARIPYYGMHQHLYTDLTMMVSLGNNRSTEYYEQFANGTAQFYHIPKSVFDEKYSHHIINEIQFLALAEHKGDGKNCEINKVWKVIDVKVVPRQSITFEQSGSNNIINKEQEYYLFKLGVVFNLNHSIRNIPDSFINSMKLSRLADLDNEKFVSISSAYEDFINKDEK